MMLNGKFCRLYIYIDNPLIKKKKTRVITIFLRLMGGNNKVILYK